MFLLLLFFLKSFFDTSSIVFEWLYVANIGAYFCMNCNWQDKLLRSSFYKACFVKRIGTFSEQKCNQQSVYFRVFSDLNAIL